MRSLGPHGEQAAPADKLALTALEVDTVRAARFTTAIVLHTVASDWARLVAAGIGDTFAAHSGAVVEIVDCVFDKAIQNRELSRLAHSPVNAVISIPVGVSGLSQAYREISTLGKKLILIDNAPAGMQSSADYVSVVSTDNFNMGAIAAALLSPHVASEGVVGILTYNADFFAANEREIAFRKWVGDNRPDLTLVRGRFAAVEDAGVAFNRLYAENPDLDGLFVTWDVPAIHTLEAIRAAPRHMPVTTVDLGNAIAAELANGDIVKGVAAQRPYDLGVAAAITALISLIGRRPPPWIVTPGIPVTRDNLAEARQAIWHPPLASRYQAAT